MQSTDEAAVTMTDYIDVAYNLMNEASNVDSSFVQNLLVDQWELFQLCSISLQLIALRVSVLMLSAPLIVACSLLGVINGLLIWYLRRTNGSRDSAYLYHRLKAAVKFTLIAFIVIYFVPPVEMEPQLIVPGFAFLTTVLSGLVIGFFKKYL